jgi:hypothetical protein
MFFTLLLLSLLFAALEKNADTSLLVLAGIFSGMIMSVKYTGVIMYLFGAAVFIYLMIRKRAGFGGVMAYLALPLLIVMPYLLKNYFFTGNPVYPFFAASFNTEEGLIRDALAYVSHVAGFGVPVNFTNFLIYPFLAVFDNRLFGGDIISPLFLISFLLLPLTDLKKTVMPAVFMLVYLTAWFFTGQVLRFLLPVVPLGALIFSQAYMKTGSKFKYAALVLLVIPQAFVSFYFAEKYLSPFKVFSQDRAEYTAERISYFPAAEFINKNAVKGSVVLLLGEARTFYIEKSVLAYTVFNHREVLDGFDTMEESKIQDGLSFRNIRYVLINYTELERLKDAGYADVYGLVSSPKFKNIMDKYFKKTYSDARCSIYELKGRN